MNGRRGASARNLRRDRRRGSPRRRSRDCAPTTRNWEGPLKKIVPWAGNRFTEAIIDQAKRTLGDDYWGFLMLGGMSGGGMGFFVAPERKEAFKGEMVAIMRKIKRELEDALPFAMDPVVYDFTINPIGTAAELLTGRRASMPPAITPCKSRG